MIDATTQKWIRNKSDELAAANGCRFDEDRGQHVLDFARRYLRLYEGDQWADKPLEPMPWQIEVTMRMFGWVRYSERLNKWIRRFRKAFILIPKKNAKTPSLSWWSLYQLMADGESGQHVYLCAKDGQQARKVAEHALQMVRRSPEILAECKVNQNTLRITHPPTSSYMEPLSSANAQTQKAKEGLNGVIAVDELHVIDREYMGRVSRVGISRSEPLDIMVSTAGSDPEGYGKEQYDKGKRVEAGDEVDESYFFACWEAPQNLTDAELAEDPLKWGQLANPAWGITIDPAEFLADYNASKTNLSELARFKMYRLNIWQASDNPWLDMSQWATCRREYKLSDLEGRECYGAFDLAKTRDTTALVLVFPDDGDYRLWPFFWLPEDMAAKRDHLAPYKQWARGGHLTLTPGDETDFGFVRQAILDALERFDLRKIFYDETYAAQLVQRLIEEDGIDAEKFERFKQGLLSFTGPTVAFQDLVSTGKLHHPGNPLLTWQAGNTRVKPDVNGNIRPVKQKHGDYRTIDGVVASIMALAAAQRVEDNDSWYTPGCLTDRNQEVPT